MMIHRTGLLVGFRSHTYVCTSDVCALCVFLCVWSMCICVVAMSSLQCWTLGCGPALPLAP
jgi:hypothetical protein